MPEIKIRIASGNGKLARKFVARNFAIQIRTASLEREIWCQNRGSKIWVEICRLGLCKIGVQIVDLAGRVLGFGPILAEIRVQKSIRQEFAERFLVVVKYIENDIENLWTRWNSVTASAVCRVWIGCSMAS
jgi:hypothetical protein